jgi:hypothetical protein
MNGTNGMNGMNGRSSLVRTATEPAGANCRNGGTAILIGLDTDGDGVLADSEVTTRTFVCGPAPKTLVRVTPEAPGANCPLGGVLVASGADADGNGTLADAEVMQRSYVCGQSVADVVIEGSVVIRNDVDYRIYRLVRGITGTLTIAQDSDACCQTAIGGPAVMDFPNLERVGRLEMASVDGVQQLSFPRLSALTARGDLYQGEGGSLRSHVTWNPSLRSLSLPSLRTLSNALDVGNNGVLDDCALRTLRGQLADVGRAAWLNVYSNGGDLLPDAGVTCPATAGCWVVRPTTPWPLGEDGGQVVPASLVDAGSVTQSFAMCPLQVARGDVEGTCRALFDGGTGVYATSALVNTTVRERANTFFGFVSLTLGGGDQRPDGGNNPDGGWSWNDGTPFGFTNWQGGEPNGGTTENCLQQYDTGMWNDAMCDGFDNFVCRVP